MFKDSWEKEADLDVCLSDPDDSDDDTVDFSRPSSPVTLSTQPRRGPLPAELGSDSGSTSFSSSKTTPPPLLASSQSSSDDTIAPRLGPFEDSDKHRVAVHQTPSTRKAKATAQALSPASSAPEPAPGRHHSGGRISRKKRRPGRAGHSASGSKRQKPGPKPSRVLTNMFAIESPDTRWYAA